MVVLLCVAPCFAVVEVPGPDGDTVNVGTGYPYVQIDSVIVNSGGTLNMYPGAYVDLGITAKTGSTVNIHGGTIPYPYWISVNYSSTVTVYGTGFTVDTGTIVDGSWTPGGYGILTGTYQNGDSFSLRFYSFYAINLVDTGPPQPPQPINVDIDIKPGTYPNPINPGLEGNPVRSFPINR